MSPTRSTSTEACTRCATSLVVSRQWVRVHIVQGERLWAVVLCMVCAAAMFGKPALSRVRMASESAQTFSK